jgi:hypothetical protein
MDTMINNWAVLGGAIFLFVMGMVWYGPLFGKVVDEDRGRRAYESGRKRQQCRKSMMPMYALQVALGLVTSYVLYTFVHMSGLGVMMGFWVWLGFAMPMAAGAMWDTQDGRKMNKFLVVAGYQLVTLVVLAWAYTMW